MSVDRLLTNVLRLYQDVHDDAQTESIYSTTTTLLTHLSNPLNVSLLTAQFLTAPAIWNRRDTGIRTCYRILSVYNTAAIHIKRNEAENAKIGRGAPRVGGGLRCEAWTRSVAKGTDERSRRWRHVLVLCGVLMGFENGGEHLSASGLSHGTRINLEIAIVTAANLALQDGDSVEPLSARAVVLALSFVFPLLSEASRGRLACHLLVPAATAAMFAEEGLQDGLFLGAIDADVQQFGHQFYWTPNSPSFRHLRDIEKRPFVSGLGPLSKLLGFAIERAKYMEAVTGAHEDLLAFSSRLLQQWQANKLSELELSEETLFLDPETLQTTWPILWQFLKKIMYGLIVVLQSIVSQSLVDPHLTNNLTAPTVATKSLHVLRNLSFISSRHGNSAFQFYTFTYMTSIDNLTRYPDQCVAFLREILPSRTTPIPMHPLDRTLDLFYLSTAEHLPLGLPAEACDSLIVQPATIYLTHTAPLSPRMVELFEAAHSAILAVLSCPHNVPITVNLAPSYAETLFLSFPSHISPRQFRLAFKTLMQILSPPFPISASHPDLAETLLEMVRFRAGNAGTSPLPSGPQGAPATEGQPSNSPEPMSEQGTLVLTLIDSLPFLHLSIVEEWMTVAALAINDIVDPTIREMVKRRFWDVLVSGEMDVERAAIGVAWWGTKGGRETVLFGRQSLSDSDDQYLMSGAVVSGNGDSRL